MSKEPVSNLAEQQTWIEPIEQPLQDAIKKSFKIFGGSAHTVRNALHGTWLHEPLHSVIVVVPLGSWTAGVAFDAAAAFGGSKDFNIAADAAIGFGLLGALGAAVTGLNDWADVKGAPRRIGAVHGLLNVVSIGMFGASWLLRRKPESRSKARVLGALAYAVISVSSHLGHNMVYEHGVGVQDTKPLE